MEARSFGRSGMKSETEYFLKRASEETRRALTSEVPEAAEAHETMSVRYSAKALALLDEEDHEQRPATTAGKKV